MNLIVYCPDWAAQVRVSPHPGGRYWTSANPLVCEPLAKADGRQTGELDRFCP